MVVKAMTRTSASCRRKADGFTLVELLVVMAIIGLLTALVAPNLRSLVDSMERSTRRGGVLADLSGLSYRAYVLGQSFELRNGHLGEVLRDGNPVLPLPEGWQAEVEAPIRFNYSGWCSGGRLKLVSPDRRVERVELLPPACELAHS